MPKNDPITLLIVYRFLELFQNKSETPCVYKNHEKTRQNLHRPKFSVETVLAYTQRRGKSSSGTGRILDGRSGAAATQTEIRPGISWRHRKAVYTPRRRAAAKIFLFWQVILNLGHYLEQRDLLMGKFDMVSAAKHEFN